MATSEDISVLVGLSLVVLRVASVLGGPSIGTPATRPSVPDSAHVLDAARDAQSDFELYRRTRLPRERGGGTPVCDVRIGRYCYWRGDDDVEDMPPEPIEVRGRRLALIAALDTAASRIPGDPWVAGQRVRYLVEADRTDDAVAAARQCRAEAWWCSALAGYAQHVGGRFAAADSSYRAALGEMKEAERCRWLDVSDVIEGDLRDRFQKLPCAERDGFVRRVVWIGAPLLSVAQTDLLTEHFARMTRARMAEHSASVDGEYWADDQRTLMMRYGWPRWFTRAEQPYNSLPSRPSITGHDAGMPYYFFPSAHGVDSLVKLRPSDWNLDDPRAPSGYTPRYARSVHDLAGQVAVFRRGDSAVVVAAWDARRDVTLTGRDLDVTLLLADIGSVKASTHGRGHNTGRLDVVAPIDSGIVSLEVLSPDDRRAGRLRVGLAPRPRSSIALSDLLLYSSADSPPETLAAARDSALFGNVVTQTRGVGVFWEGYGLPADSRLVEYTIVVEQFGTSWMRRTAERLRLADPTRGTRVQWQEAPRSANGIAPRGVRLDLARLRTGRYRVTLNVKSADGQTASTTREIEIRDR